MFNEFKNGETVIVCGIGKKNGKLYKNKSAVVIERDTYFKDYHLKFKDGTDDWFEPEDIRKPLWRRSKKK